MSFKSSILKYGTQGQVDALKKLGSAASNINTDKLKSSYSASIFEGDLKNLQNSELGKVLSTAEIKQMFKLLDKNGDGKLSTQEISNLANLSGSSAANKIEKDDLKEMLQGAKTYSDSLKKSTSADKVTTKKGKNGTKTVINEKADGTKVVTKYNKNGQKTSSVKTDVNGDKTATKYNYVYGHMVEAKSKKTRMVDGKKVTLSTSGTVYNKKGQKVRSVTKDTDGNILFDRKFTYANNGKLSKVERQNADGSAIKSTYDTTTGKRTSKVTKNADGKVISKDDYDAKTGIRKNRTAYQYDEDGKVKSTSTYTFNSKGEYATREKYDANKNLVSKSTYVKNKDGSMLRTDRDPKSGQVIGSALFEYNKAGKLISKTDKDADGNIKEVENTEYYANDIPKSTTTVKYNKDGSYTKEVNKNDKLGNLTSVTTSNYDKDNKKISSETKDISVKKTKIKDLPKIDYKKLEKIYGGDGKALVDFAKQFMGYNESNGSYKKFTNGRTEAWCADFVTYVVKNYAKSNGKNLKSGFGSPSVYGLMTWAQNKGIFKNTHNLSNSEKLNYAKNKLKPGDIIIWKSGDASHTGIVKSVGSDGSFTTIEGNSSDQVKSNTKSIYATTLTGFIPFSKLFS